MTGDIYLKLITSEFAGGDEERQVNYAGIVSLALDNAKKAKLEAIYLCYVPFYALNLKNDHFLIVNAMNTTKNMLTVSKLPTTQDIKAIMEKKISQQEKFQELEDIFITKKTVQSEISGIVNRAGVSAIAKLVTQHKSTMNNTIKKVTPIVQKEDGKNQLQNLKKLTLSEQELKDNVDKLLEETEKFIHAEIEAKKKERDELEKKYDNDIQSTKTEISNKLKQIDSEEKAEHDTIIQKGESDRASILSQVKNNPKWKQLGKDLATIDDAYKTIIDRITKIDSSKDFAGLMKTIDSLQDEIQTFGTSTNSLSSEVENRKIEYDDVKNQVEVDKRNVSDRLNGIKEDEKHKIVALENEKKSALRTKDDEINQTKEWLKKFESKKKNWRDTILKNFELISAFTLTGDLLDIGQASDVVTIYVQVAISRYKEKNRLIYDVIPPFEIPSDMKKVKNLPLKGNNGKIGFDCVDPDAFDFIKTPLEDKLSIDPNLQAEIQGEQNEVIRTGDLTTMDAGLKIFELRKKLNKKDADNFLAFSRELWS